MKVISFFNNKGGVGKTTLTCNVASHFARSGKRVLVVDADPQCNATQLIVGDQKTLDLYWPELHTKQIDTLFQVTNPIRSGNSNVETNISFLSPTDNRFSVSLLPGHPRLSEIEDKLSVAWSHAVGGDIEGLRRTNWANAFLSSFSAQFDYVFVDLGPSLGALNRSVLLASDYFVTPLGADIFSIVGIRNIAEWLTTWLSAYMDGVGLLEKRTPSDLDTFKIIRSPLILHGYAGYTLQQYITKSKKGVRRPTVAFEKILNDVPDQIEAYLGELLAPHLTKDGSKLGDVPHMYSLVPLAQSHNAPIDALKETGALVGNQFKQSQEYGLILREFAVKLARNVGDDLEASL